MVIRRTLLLVALLIACSPASDRSDAPAPASAPTESPTGAVPRTVRPKPAREHTPQRRSDGLQAGKGYYQYVDESGRIRFAANLADVPESQRATAGHVSVEAPARPAPASRNAAAGPSASSTEVVLYTTSSCPYCRRAAAYLDQIGQSYTNKDIEDDAGAADDMLAITGGRHGVPVIVVGQKWMQGWNQSQLDQLLADAR